MDLHTFPYLALQQLAVFEIVKTYSARTFELARRTTRPEVIELNANLLDYFATRGEAPHCSTLIKRLEDPRIRCFGAVSEERLMAFAWTKVGTADKGLNLGYRPGTAATLKLPDSAAFLFHAYTAPLARQRGWMTCLVRHAADVMRVEENVDNMVTTTEIINGPARSLFRNLGFREIGDYWRIGVGNWSTGWYPRPTAPVLAYG